jgi:D-beta-D-heptose 7-phosphate kinase/D-beta-D-heptose 1-phosphate adenosyltransferase
MTPADQSELATALEKMAAARVLCVGDVMLDRFVYGDVRRISPEAPIPVFRTGEHISMLGGAGNVARNAAGLGAQVHFVSVTGDDGAGAEVSGLFSELPGAQFEIFTDGTRKTSIKTRYIASGQQMMRADDETVAPLGKDLRAKLFAAAETALDICPVMILADYAKGVLADGVAGALIKLAKARGVTVIVDPQGFDYAPYSGAQLITPNRKELGEASGLPVESDADIAAAARQLIKAHKIDAVLATRSADGMTLIRGNDGVRHFPAHAREVFDVSGAGDTVAATLGVALAGGLREDQAVQLANVAAGIVVGKVGTAVAYRGDVAAALLGGLPTGGGDKVQSLQAALGRVREWRAQGAKIGLASGCFDLLHPGHLAVIRKAKSACGRLIIGINSDASTHRLKGPERPIQNEAARAEVIASLEAVDMVVIFGEDTPEALIGAIKPDVFVKGADYAVDDLPEAAIIKSYGGEIILAEMEDGYSTTATIRGMNGNSE